MAKVTRRVTKTETIATAPCPLCGGDVSATDCGYTTFNPGSAECQKCGESWALGFVNDSWHAAKDWNKLAARIAADIEALNAITTKPGTTRAVRVRLKAMVEKLKKHAGK